MFCRNCGVEAREGASFCHICGTRYIEENYQPKAKKKRSYGKMFLILGVFLCFSLLTIGGLRYYVHNQQLEFDIPYTSAGIQEFMNAVCENVEAEYTYVESPKYSGFASQYDTEMTSSVRVKLPGIVEEIVGVSFQNEEDADQVSHIYISYSHDDTENEKACADVVVKAIEESFCGESSAQQYTNQMGFPKMEGYVEKYTIAEYMLTDNVAVEIYWHSYFTDDWYGIYHIYYKE